MAIKGRWWWWWLHHSANQFQQQTNWALHDHEFNHPNILWHDMDHIEKQNLANLRGPCNTEFLQMLTQMNIAGWCGWEWEISISSLKKNNIIIIRQCTLDWPVYLGVQLHWVGPDWRTAQNQFGKKNYRVRIASNPSWNPSNPTRAHPQVIYRVQV